MSAKFNKEELKYLEAGNFRVSSHVKSDKDFLGGFHIANNGSITLTKLFEYGEAVYKVRSPEVSGRPLSYKDFPEAFASAMECRGSLTANQIHKSNEELSRLALRKSLYTSNRVG